MRGMVGGRMSTVCIHSAPYIEKLLMDIQEQQVKQTILLQRILDALESSGTEPPYPPWIPRPHKENS